jgi:hypothetical protein
MAEAVQLVGIFLIPGVVIGVVAEWLGYPQVRRWATMVTGAVLVAALLLRGYLVG